MSDSLPFQVTLEVYERCLCLSVHRAARALARRFDAALAPYGLNHGQFSLLMSLNRPTPPRLGETARFLAMDRTTLTANLKPLERQGHVSIIPDEDDRRSKRLVLTQSGHAVLKAALPVWREMHNEVDRLISAPPAELRAQLLQIADPQPAGNP